MKKEELIKRYCRFYKGEDDFNFEENDWTTYLCWKGEYSYIKDQGTRETEDAMRCYKECGLYSATDEIPYDLAATLFAVYCHGTDRDPIDLAESFKNDFLPYYLAKPI